MRTVGPWSWSLEFSVFFCISSSPSFFLFSSFGFSFSNASLPSLSTHLRIVSHTMGTQATATTADQSSSQQDGTRRLTTVKSDESDERENGAPQGATDARTHARTQAVLSISFGVWIFVPFPLLPYFFAFFFSSLWILFGRVVQTGKMGKQAFELRIYGEVQQLIVQQHKSRWSCMRLGWRNGCGGWWG